MINGRRSVDDVGIPSHSGRHTRGRRGQISRIHGDLGTGMDPPDIRRAAGRSHARCPHHPGPHPAHHHRPTGLPRKCCEHTRTSWPIDLSRFIPLEREKCLPALGDEDRERVNREPASQPASQPRRLSRRQVPRDIHGVVATRWCPSRAALATRDTDPFVIISRPRGLLAIDATTAMTTTVYRDAKLADAKATGATRLGGPREG